MILTPVTEAPTEILFPFITCEITLICSYHLICSWLMASVLKQPHTCSREGKAGAAARRDGCRRWHRHVGAAVQQYLQAASLLFAERLKKANCTVAHTPRSRCCHWPAATSSEPTELTDTSAQHIRNHLF